jgi:hypothetical protein
MWEGSDRFWEVRSGRHGDGGVADREAEGGVRRGMTWSDVAVRIRCVKVFEVYGFLDNLEFLLDELNEKVKKKESNTIFRQSCCVLY